jgi:hypothetical protein
VTQSLSDVVPPGRAAVVGPLAVWKVLVRGVAVTFPLLVVAHSALSDESMRCSGWIVSAPISVEELLRKCGEPVKKEATTEDIRASEKSGTGSRRIGTTAIEKWTYNPDGQSLPMIVTVVEGKATRIDREK